MSKMKSSTPARLLSQRAIRANTTAMLDCFYRVKGWKPKTALDIRYGTGAWAHKLCSKFPKLRLWGIESDEETLETAWKCEEITTACGRFPDDVPSSWPRRFDLLLADFNNSTIADLSPLREAIERARAEVVIVTDVACSKLHMNYESYGLSRSSLDDYYKLMKLDGYRFLGYSRSQHHASTSIWRAE